MLICDVCHDARRARPAIGAQPLQWTGYETGKQMTMNCPDCGRKRAGVYREYLNAFELVQELGELKEKIPSAEWPVTFYESASDMLEHCLTTGRAITEEEAWQILQYAADLEC